VGEHVVDLLIYPLAVVSAVMAVPAMASYGATVYGSATGRVLPVLSELGMWAFAIATSVSRRRFPDRPVWALQAGTAVFAMIGAGLNIAHGLTASGRMSTAAVMGVVSVAGVTAHQLVTASPRRGRDEWLARLAERRVARVRRIATRRAVVDVRADGGVSLVYAPGRYVTRRGRLVPAIVPGLPVEPLTDWDAALADLLDADASTGDPTTETDLRESSSGAGGDSNGSGAVATLDKPTGRVPIDPHARRGMSPDDALDAARRIARELGRPVSAERLRSELRIAARSARKLRDRVNAELYPNEG
jgi:hypothetical protein